MAAPVTITTTTSARASVSQCYGKIDRSVKSLRLLGSLGRLLVQTVRLIYCPPKRLDDVGVGDEISLNHRLSGLRSHLFGK